MAFGVNIERNSYQGALIDEAFGCTSLQNVSDLPDHRIRETIARFPAQCPQVGGEDHVLHPGHPGLDLTEPYYPKGLSP